MGGGASLPGMNETSSVGGTGTSAKQNLSAWRASVRFAAARGGVSTEAREGGRAHSTQSHRGLSLVCVLSQTHSPTDGRRSIHRTPQNSQQGQQATSVPSAGAHSNAPIMVSSLPRDDGPDIKAINDTGTCFFFNPQRNLAPLRRQLRP